MTQNSYTSWLRSVDYAILGSTCALIVIGFILMMTVSPVVAVQHHWTPFILLRKYLFFLFPGIIVLIISSFLNKEQIILSAMAVWFVACLLIIFIIFFGTEIKGAKRWIEIFGVSTQPSEFLKVSAIILTAWIFSRFESNGIKASMLFIIGTIAPITLQPDIGMVFIIASVWIAQCFVAGMRIIWLFICISLGACGSFGAYCCFPHVQARVNSFLFSATDDKFGAHFQILKSLSAFASGGIFGKGPGAGTVLNSIPDSHCDFIFAVAAEEFGLIFCIFIIFLYMVIIMKSLYSVLLEGDKFYLLAVSGIAISFAMQVFMNIASVLRLIPTKGITLPFLSYGGSSFISMCWMIGMLLSLTRRYRNFW